MAEYLNNIADETAVPMSEIGHGVGDEEGKNRHADDTWQW